MTGFRKHNLTVFFKDSRGYPEIQDNSVDLLIGDGVHLGYDWKEYEKLFNDIYIENALRVLKDSGVFVTKITDAYHNGEVFPRGNHLLNMLLPHYKLLDVKIWERCKVNFFQPPTSYFYILVKKSNKATRCNFSKFNKPFLRGVWDFPQSRGGELNSWNSDLCYFILSTFTKKGDVILDGLAGTCRLLILGANQGRICYGYEKNEEMETQIKKLFFVERRKTVLGATMT